MKVKRTFFDVLNFILALLLSAAAFASLIIVLPLCLAFPAYSRKVENGYKEMQYTVENIDRNNEKECLAWFAEAFSFVTRSCLMMVN
jgi:hypothetical protein